MQLTPLILCFGDLYWRNGLERNHSILKNLIEAGLFDRGVYVEPSLWLSTLYSEKQSLGSLLKRHRDALEGKLKIKQVVHFMPFKNKISQLNNIEKAVIRCNLFASLEGSNYTLLINRIAFDIDDILVELIQKAKFSIFDFSDDFREFFTNNHEIDQFNKFVEKIVTKVDLVIHVNEHVKGKYSNYNKNNMVIRNATNFKNFDRSHYNKIEIMEKIKAQYSKIIGYIGTANLVRLDLAAIVELVSNKPDWAFVFVGSIGNEIKTRLHKFLNIIYINFVPYTDLPDYLNYFDVCTAPMLINDHTAGNDLLKLHDYLAMSKPVVASNVGGSSDLEGVTIYNDPEDFVIKIEQELEKPNTPEFIEKRKETARENSWEHRLGPLRNYLINHIQ